MLYYLDVNEKLWFLTPNDCITIEYEEILCRPTADSIVILRNDRVTFCHNYYNYDITENPRILSTLLTIDKSYSYAVSHMETHTANLTYAYKTSTGVRMVRYYLDLYGKTISLRDDITYQCNYVDYAIYRCIFKAAGWNLGMMVNENNKTKSIMITMQYDKISQIVSPNKQYATQLINGVCEGNNIITHSPTQGIHICKNTRIIKICSGNAYSILDDVYYINGMRIPICSIPHF